MDAAFHLALKQKAASTEWALRAVAGYTMRVHCANAEDREQANKHGLSRAITTQEREAWSFGFTWPDRFS